MTGAETVTTAQAIIRRLEQHGVRHVFGIPGTHNLPLYRALAESSIEHVTPRHEQGAGYAADGYARVSGRPAVCLVTTGPGVLNTATAAAQAYSDSVPMILLSPAMDTRVDGRDTGHLHELKDQHGVMERLVARCDSVHTPADAVAAVDAAFADFACRRPRPVHIQVPLDAMAAVGTVDDHPPARLNAPVADPADLDEVARLLQAAHQPALILGGGAVDASAEATAVARMAGAAVVTTLNGKGVVAETDPLSLGASLRLRTAKAFLAECDVVVAVGTELAESDLWEERSIELDLLVRMDIDHGQLRKNAIPQLGIAADAGEGLAGIAARLQHDRPVPDLAGLKQVMEREARAEGEPFVALIETLRTELPDAAVVTGDSAQVCYYGLAHYLKLPAPRRFLYPTGLATLGYGLPAAIGAKLAQPSAPVVAVMGDGGFMFTLPELASAVQHELAVVVLVVDNGGFGEIRRQMLEEGIPPTGVDFDSPDFAAVARAMGARGRALDNLSGLGDALKEGLTANGPTVIHLQGWS